LTRIEDVDARDKRGHDESEIMIVGMIAIREPDGKKYSARSDIRR
jgi:hypothetical protein